MDPYKNNKIQKYPVNAIHIYNIYYMHKNL